MVDRRSETKRAGPADVPPVPDRARGKSPASAFYRALKDSQQLLLATDEVRWADTYTGADRSTGTVVNFGCGVQHTPHVMVATVAVLEALGVDFQAVAGRQWCCGMPCDPAYGTRMAAASTRRMAAYDPSETVHWCGAWWVQLPPVAAQLGHTPFELTPMAAFLARQMEELGDRAPWQGELEARVLLHPPPPHDGRMADRAAVRAVVEAAVPSLMNMVPGVEVVGVAPNPSRGAPCTIVDGRSQLADLRPEEHLEVRREMEAHADDVGADMIVCAHHLCSREWGKFRSDRLPVRHYVEVVAEALGVGQPDRFHDHWELEHPETIVRRARPQWKSWGLDEDAATLVAERLFNRSAPPR